MITVAGAPTSLRLSSTERAPRRRLFCIRTPAAGRARSVGGRRAPPDIELIGVQLPAASRGCGRAIRRRHGAGPLPSR